MPVMNFDLEDGKAPITIRLDANDCERFMAFLDDCQKRRPRSGEQASKQKSRETNKALAKPLSDVFRNFGKEPEIMPLIDAYATARGEVGNEHFSHECLALREQIRTKLLGEQASAVNQGLIEALSHIGQGYGDELRIAPETRSINGVVFAAPKPECTFDIRICTGAQYLDNVTFTWSDQVERDKAMQAILDALNGVTG